MQKTYSSADLAKIACLDCCGCGACCRGMGDSVHLDPYDVYRLTQGLHLSFEEMKAAGYVDFHREGALILPHLCMQENGYGDCIFLRKDGACNIHAFRPGLCRLFPLGRDFDATSRSFRYFIVENGCTMPHKAKVKISKWLDIPSLSRYESFVSDWHYFLRDAGEALAASDEAYREQLNLFILKVFFFTPCGSSPEEFYTAFRIRLTQASSAL